MQSKKVKLVTFSEMRSEKVKFILYWGRKKKRFLCHRNNLKSKIAKRLDITTNFSLEVLKKNSNEWVPVSPSDLCDMDEVRVANLHGILKSEGEVNGVEAEEDGDSSSDEELCDSLRQKLKENIALDAGEKRFLCDLLWCRPKSMRDYKNRKMENKSTQTGEDEGKINEHRGELQKETSDKEKEVKKSATGMEIETKMKVFGEKEHNESKDNDETESGDAANAEGKEKQDEEEVKRNDESKVNFGESEEKTSEDEKGAAGLSSDSELKTKSNSPDEKDEEDQKATDDGMFSSASGLEASTEVRSENCPNEEKPAELVTSLDTGNETLPDLMDKKTENEEKEKEMQVEVKSENCPNEEKPAELATSSDTGYDLEPLKPEDSHKESSESVSPQPSVQTPHSSPDTGVKTPKKRPSIRIKSFLSPSIKGHQLAASGQLRSPESKKRKKGDDSLSHTAKVDLSSEKRKSTTSRSSRVQVPSEKSEGERSSEPPGKKRKSEVKKKKKKEDTPKKPAHKQVKEMREHMIAELKKDSPDDDKIRKLMDETFRARQDYILNDTPRIKVVRETYPALFNIKEVVREFNRIKEEDNYEKYKQNLKAYADIVLENVPLTSSSPVVDIVKEKLNEDLSDEEKDYVKLAAVILLLPAYLKEDVQNFISFVKVTKSVFPLVTCNVPLEKVLSSDARFTILVERNKLCTSASLVEAFFAFISAFYIFNIEFPEECTQTITVIESLFLEMEPFGVSLSEEVDNVKTLFHNKLKENERRAADAKKDESCDKERDSSKQNGDGSDGAKGEEEAEEGKGFSGGDEEPNGDVREKSTEGKNDSDEREKDGSESRDQ